jgi:hypothetical protein
MTKSIFASKTIWVNGLAFIAAMGAALGLDLGLDSATQTEIAAGGLAIVNVILRLFTKKPVTV